MFAPYVSNNELKMLSDSFSSVSDKSEQSTIQWTYDCETSENKYYILCNGAFLSLACKVVLVVNFNEIYTWIKTIDLDVTTFFCYLTKYFYIFAEVQL